MARMKHEHVVPFDADPRYEDLWSNLAVLADKNGCAEVPEDYLQPQLDLIDGRKRQREKKSKVVREGRRALSPIRTTLDILRFAVQIGLIEFTRSPDQNGDGGDTVYHIRFRQRLIPVYPSHS